MNSHIIGADKMSLNTIQQDHYYTYEEFQAIDDGNHYELHKGELYLMSSPASDHQAMSVELTIQLGSFLRDKPCLVYHALDVRLFKDEDTVFTPDILVVCEKSKIVKRGCEGAPDFIIEIASPSNAYRDYLIKYKEYQRAGVREYWIIDLDHQKIFVNILKDTEFELSQRTFKEPAAVHVLPGCLIDLSAFGQ